MIGAGIYLMKVCAYILAFYIPFALIFKRTTFFTINRIYLLTGLALSFALPLYTTVETISAYVPAAAGIVEPVFTQTESFVARASEGDRSIGISTLLFIFYLIGICARTVALIVSITRTTYIVKSGKTSVHENFKVVRADTRFPFSFFNFIVLPKNFKSSRAVLQHEAAHIRQLHWMDLTLVELASVILWFNPMMIIYKRLLQQQHEYLADRATMHAGIEASEYLLAIRHQIEVAAGIPLSSLFNFQSIKKRINMLTKKRTSALTLLVYSSALPLIVVLLGAFSSPKYFTNNPTKQILAQDLQFELPINPSDNFAFESGYGKRMHPTLGVVQLHTGIDLSAKEGVPVLSAEAGVVVRAELADSWGNIIIIQHDGTFSTSYSHMKSMSVKKGDKVEKGQMIGLVGHTGLSTKDHLHFEILKNGNAIDPVDHLPALK